MEATITRKQPEGKLMEYGPKKPAAISTLQHFGGAFVCTSRKTNEGMTEKGRDEDTVNPASALCPAAPVDASRRSSTRQTHTAYDLNLNWNKKRMNK